MGEAVPGKADSLQFAWIRVLNKWQRRKRSRQRFSCCKRNGNICWRCMQEITYLTTRRWRVRSIGMRVLIWRNVAWDDLTGSVLDCNEVWKARCKEPVSFSQHPILGESNWHQRNPPTNHEYMWFPRRMENIQKRTVVGANSAAPTRLDQLTALDWEVDTFALVAWQKITRTTVWTCVFHSLVDECPQLIMDRTKEHNSFHTSSSAFSLMNAVLLAGFRRFSVIPAAPWVDGNNVTNFTSLWRALRGVEGAVTWGQSVVFRLKSRRVMSLIGPRMNGLSIWHEAATNTSFNIADSVRNILHNRSVLIRSARHFLSIQLFKINYEFLANVSVTLIHVRSTFEFKNPFLKEVWSNVTMVHPEDEPRKD